MRGYAKRGRFIPQELYVELKRVKKCEFCGLKAKRLEIHHKVPVSEGGLNERSNLVAICKECHIKEHEEDG